jgi:3-oxoacyl-[acyl-carrier-protein] synthase II
MTGMAPEGEGCFRSMKHALRVAGIEPDRIDYVNAHATSTPLGDALESKAIENVFGERALNHTLLVSSTKSMTGHLLGGAGGLEAAITIIAMQKQIAPPTMNLENVDPQCRLNYVANKWQPAKIDYALSNSFGFGGTNGSLVFKRWGAA